MSDTLIHVRFAIDGTVTAIGEAPPDAMPQTWFNFLTRRAGPAYEALAGGRGVFRLSSEQLGELHGAFLPGGSA